MLEIHGLWKTISCREFGEGNFSILTGLKVTVKALSDAELLHACLESYAEETGS